MLAFVMLAAVASVLPKPGELKSFDDWAVGCDNIRSCTAVSLMEMESGENQLTVRISRGGGRSDVPRLSIANIENRSSGALSLVVDGIVAVGSGQVEAEAPFTLALDADAIRKLGGGRTVELRNADGASLGGASLKGILAALRYMDDRQARANNASALVAVGSLPPTSVAPPPPLPVIATAPAKSGRTMPLSSKDIAALQARTACDAEGGNIEAREAYRLDHRTWLALVPCGSGAYNFTSVPVLVTRGSASRRMKLAEFDFAPGFTDADGTPLLVNADWDATSGTLNSFAKGRGLGDCGNAESYVWDGRKFRLTSRTAMEECRGVIEWIPVWQAKAVRR